MGVDTYPDRGAVLSTSPFPYCLAARSADQVIATGGADVIWDSVVTDTHGGLNTGTGIYTFPEDGIYTVSYMLRFTASTAGTYRQGQVLFNVSNAYAIQKIPPMAAGAGAMFVSSAVTMDRAAGDTVKIRADHDTGSNLNINASHCRLTVAKVVA